MTRAERRRTIRSQFRIGRHQSVGRAIVLLLSSRRRFRFELLRKLWIVRQRYRYPSRILNRGCSIGSATIRGMTALHIRNLPESVVTALRERAARHGQSMQQEIRQILEAAATASPPRQAPEPVRLTTVRTAVTSTWDREEIYGDAGR